MTVSCTNDYACYGSDFYCPTNAECNIACIDGDYACYNANFYVEKNEYTGLNLHCDTNASATCSGAGIICSDSGLSSSLRYNYSNDFFECNSYACCPMFDGTITCSSSDCQVVFKKYNYIMELIISFLLSFCI